MGSDEDQIRDTHLLVEMLSAAEMVDDGLRFLQQGGELVVCVQGSHELGQAELGELRAVWEEVEVPMVVVAMKVDQVG